MDRKSSMKIVYDIDGFFSPANMSLDHKSISVAIEEQPIETLFEQYYLGLRSAMFICEDTINDEAKALDALRMWREGCLKTAMEYVDDHTKRRKVSSPDFVWIIKSAIVEELKNKYDGVVDIQLWVSMRPKLTAKVIDKNVIMLPALARSVLIHYNLLLINSYLRSTKPDDQIGEEPDFRFTARFMLPYLLFCHDDFSVQNLPIIGAHSIEALNIAMQFTNIQLLFILAHEHAHIHLNHLDVKEINSEIKMRLEREADKFALELVLGSMERTNLYSKNDVFTSIRWLFKYQLLEDSVGELIRGDELRFAESKFEERRGLLQSELINNHKLKGTSLLEIHGFVTLVRIQSILYEQGAEFIEYIISTFKKSIETKSIEPWWEKITTK